MKKFIKLKPVRISGKIPLSYDSVILPDIAIRKENIVSIEKANYPNTTIIMESGEEITADCVFLKVIYKVNEEKFEEILVNENFDEVLAKLEA